MKLFLLNNFEDFTETRLRAELCFLPAWRQKVALFYRNFADRVRSVMAYRLLQRGLRECYGIEASPTFDFIGNGKPVLREFPQIHFNLSHCERGVLCVLDDVPAGCDIEAIAETLDETTMNYCFNESEIAGTRAAENPCVEFAKIWTRKEAVLKLAGTGILDDLRDLMTRERLAHLSLETVVDECAGFVYSVCRERDFLSTNKTK